MVKTIELSSPFAEYFSYFEFYPVKISELNTGVTHPRSSTVYPDPEDCNVINTISPGEEPSINIAPLVTNIPAFGSSLDNFGIHRGLASDVALVNSFVDNVLQWDYSNLFIIVVSNTDIYAGTANIDNKLFTISGNLTDGINIPYGDEQGAVHEFGHSFAMLQDDYFFECPHCEGFNCLTFNSAPNRYEGPDVNVVPPFTALPWSHWFASNGVPFTTTPPIGNFHLSNPNSPNQELRKSCLTGCKMYDINSPFCAVCREAIIERIHDLVSPVNSYSPANDEGPITASSSVVFDLNLTVPNPNTMRVIWEMENSEGEVINLETDYNNATDANGNAGAGVGAPGGFYRWHLECARFEEEGFNTAGDYTVRARIFDMTASSEGASNRWVRHPQHEIDEDDETNGNHEEIVEWTVNFKGIPGVDLYSMDQPDDTGIEPYVASDILWTSSDIWLCSETDLDCEIEDESQIIYSSGAQAQVNVRIQNRGCERFNASENEGSVNLYWAKAGTGLEWPISWNGDFLEPGVLAGQLIDNIIIDSDVDINGDGIVVSATWDLIDPSIYEEIDGGYGGENVTHFCFLSVIDVSELDPYTMQEDPEELYPLYANVKASNNVVWRNLTILDDQGGGIIGQTTSTDVIRGGAVIVSNNESEPRDYKIKFEVPVTETGKPITEEAEVRIILSDSLWSKWIDGGQQAYKVAVYDSSLHQLLLEDTLCTLSGIQLDSNTHFGMYVSVNFLTKERTSKELFNLSVTQIRDDTTQRVLGGEMYAFMPDPNRSYFTANAGPDQEVVVGTVYESKASTLSETAIYNWYNSNGNRLSTSSVFSDTASSAGSETFKLELIATTDGYKDYDEVTIVKKLGRITSVVPNPISNGTLAIGYNVSTGVSVPKIRIVNVNTSTYTEHIITTGTGTLNIDISAYASGAHSILLICDSTTADDELLIVQ